MHPLTKVLTVLAALLSIALAALTIAYTANAERIRGEFGTERELRLAAQDTAARDVTAHSAEKARLEQENAGLQEQLSRLEGSVAGLQQENARILADLKTREAEGLAVQAKIDQLSATNQTLSTLISRYRDEVTTLRNNELQFARREIELADRVSDLSGQLEVAIENNRALQEQLVEARDQLASSQAGGGGASIGALADQTIRPSFPVRARVTGVTRDAAGNVLVQVDAGSTDRLRQRMELSLVRGDQFIGKVVLETVDIEESVGRVDFLGRSGLEAREGDLIVSLVR